ncbi:condensation domain-containing protein, partial [Rhizobium leguminosarum]
DSFFALGGHSLLAVRMIARLSEQGMAVDIRGLFTQPVLKDLAAIAGALQAIKLPAIERVDRTSPLALSYAQQRLWFLSQLDGVSEAYHMPAGIRLAGHLDRSALGLALDGIVARHEALRTRFDVIDSEPVQVIGDADIGFALTDTDLRLLGSDEARQTAVERLAVEEWSAPFDLGRGPLMRGRLVRLGEEEHVLLVTMHHIVSDGWSIGVMIREFVALYDAYSQGRDGLSVLPGLEIQYADYAHWQRQYLSGAVLEAQADYWRDALKDAPALLELPADRRRPAQQDHAGGRVALALDGDLTAKLKTLSARHGTTLFMTLLAGFGALLSRLSGQEDVVIGTPVANRTRSEVEGLIGFFANTLALRLELSDGPTVQDLLLQVKARSLSAQMHQDLPFEQVVELVQPARSLSHSPLFQVMFAWQNNEQVDLALPGLTLSSFDAAEHVTAKFDLTLDLSEIDGRIVGALEYASALFDRTTAERFGRYLV